MSVASDQTDAFEKASVCEPHSRRVGISGTPSYYRLSTSTTDTSDSASWTTPPSSPLLTSSSPPRPPRSPLRPTGPEQRVSSSSSLKPDLLDVATDIDDVMPLSHSRSFGSLSGMLNSQTTGVMPGGLGRAQTPDKPLPMTPDPSTSSATLYDDHDHAHDSVLEPVDCSFASDSGSSSLLKPTITSTKRVRALEELLSSERAYASDLAILRDVHIPMAAGEYARDLISASTTEMCQGNLHPSLRHLPPRLLRGRLCAPNLHRRIRRWLRLALAPLRQCPGRTSGSSSTTWQTWLCSQTRSRNRSKKRWDPC